ncbi:cytochrome P450 monooxygenase [Coleophoma crateriformis]|uniref:Cytochrome P450 monooxygenase n=1 Tax=Coleophoma crateriformis TaxID=565419 RepID=A0A3D8RVN8_9HELO|nr:cytochrome P450 monooxygenase [Coleophoma crateriformis]
MLGTLAAISLAVFLVFYVFVVPVVEYFRDPKGLRRYPGMTWYAGITNLAMMLESHRGFRSQTLVNLHKKYPVIRTGPNALSYGDVRAIKDIYGHNTKCLKDGNYTTLAGSHFNLADVIDRGDHSRKRKILSAAYALKNLEAWEFKVADKTERLVKQFDTRCTPPLKPGVAVPAAEDLTVDYRMWTNFFSLDAIADIGLSEKLGFLDNGHDRITAQRTDGSIYEVNFRECVYNNAHLQSLLIWNYSWYHRVKKIASHIPFYGRKARLGQGFDGIVLAQSSKRLKRYQNAEKLDDFFQVLMEDKTGKPNNLEWGEIVAEVNVMMNAGSVTTAIAMANVLHQLLKHPQMLEKLRSEVDAVLDDDEVVAPYEKVKNLPYLRACLDESLRLFPPTSHGLTRATPPEGAVILGDFIAGDTTVSMSALVAHRDEKVYPQAEKFIPDRWLDDNGKELQPYFITFSAGARGCIGRNISYLEQTVLLASMVHRYEFALPSPNWEIKRLETFNLILGEMPVKVWRRNLGKN